MPKNAPIEFDEWLHRARKDGNQFTAELLHSYRDYLRLLARMQLSKLLSVRVSPSDIVQESLLAAKTAFTGFQGTTEAELLSWLRRVLASRIVDALRFHSAGRRDMKLEQRIDQRIDGSSIQMAEFVASSKGSPSQIAAQREQALLLSDALQRLPDDYGEVIVQRHLESRSFAEIAERMNRTVPSIKSIWTRAMTKLRDELGETER